jgi:hypothetical protein
MWDLWWMKWHWDRPFSKHFDVSLSASFHQCSKFMFDSYTTEAVNVTKNSVPVHPSHTAISHN